MIGEWKNMLGHQLQALPPFEQFWKELPNIFAWLEGRYAPEKVIKLSLDEGEDSTWNPPPTIWKWGLGIPLESIRFAAINHLCVKLGYRGTVRIIEPYSLRQTKDVNLILHATKIETREPHSYRIDRIENIEVTNRPFVPEYEIEFSSAGSIETPPTSRKYGNFGVGKKMRTSATRRKTTSGFTDRKYIFQCGLCQKKFKRARYDSTLRKHKNSLEMDCPGRTGFFVGNTDK